MITIYGTLLTWTASNTEDMLDTAGSVIGDFQDFLIPILAVFIGLMVLGAIFKFLRG